MPAEGRTPDLPRDDAKRGTPIDAMPPVKSPTATGAAKRSYHVEAIQRGLDVLALFRADRPSLTLIEISRLVAAVPSTTLRIVNTLEDLGFLESVPGQGAYRAGPSALRVGHAMIAGSRLRASVHPSLERLRDASREAVSLGEMQGASVYFIDHLGTDDPMALSMPVGAMLPAYCTAAGKAMLAYSSTGAVGAALQASHLKRLAPRTRTSREDIVRELEAIRQEGFAIQDEEVAVGMRSIAAPVLDGSKRAIAAITVAVGSGRYEMAELKRIIAPLVVGAAAEAGARWRADDVVAGAAPALPVPDGDGATSDGPADAERSRYHVEALARGLLTLLAFTPAAPRLSLTEIAQRTDCLISTTFRVVATLTALGYVRADEASGRYELSPHALSLGYDGLAWLNLAELALPRLLRFQAETGHSVYLSVLGGDVAVDILSLGRPGVMSTIGRSYPLYCTPGGKILLAYMPDAKRDEVLHSLELAQRAPRTLVDRDALRAELAVVRERGFSMVREEFLPGSCGVGVPVLDSAGRCVASLAVVYRGSGVATDAVLDEMRVRTREAGDDLSARLAWRFS